MRILLDTNAYSALKRGHAELADREGRPIPTNDVWIAAHAMETGAELVPSDEHFEAIDGLAWFRPSARAG